MRYRSGHIYNLTALLMLSFCLCGCNSGDCLHDSGTMTKTHIETGYFHTININGIFDIFLTQDTITYVDLEGGDKALDYAQAQNGDSVLLLNNTNSCSFKRDYTRIKVYVHFSKIDNINISECCNIKTTNAITHDITIAVGAPLAEIDMETENQGIFFYTNTGTAGTYIFKGHCNNCTLWGYYASKIDASALICKTLHIRNASIADYYVYAEDKLVVDILSNGNVLYYGNPVVVSDSVTGSGRIIKADNK
jgi:hypothetical protein